MCSAADNALDSGALATITPALVAAATSTLSSPIPARPTTESLSAAASSSAVTWGGRTNDERVGPDDRVQELARLETEANIDLVAGGAEALQSGFGDRFGHEYARHDRHPSLRAGRPANLGRR